MLGVTWRRIEHPEYVYISHHQTLIIKDESRDSLQARKPSSEEVSLRFLLRIVLPTKIMIIQ